MHVELVLEAKSKYLILLIKIELNIDFSFELRDLAIQIKTIFFKKKFIIYLLS